MLPNRKKNRLADYSYSQPGAYFITVCTAEKRCILSTVVGADAHIGPKPSDDHRTSITPQICLTPIGTVVEKYLRTIPGIGEYVIMPNHVHMILHISASPQSGPMWASAPTKADIPGMIRSWKTLIGKELGRSIWQRSYYDHIIRDQNDYNIRVQYIRENPAKWFFDDYYIP